MSLLIHDSIGCSDENNCFGGAILSDQTLRYIMGARTVDADPPFFSGAIGCSPNDPALNFDKNQLQEAVKKFCKGTEGAWPLQEGTDYNTSQIPNWHRDFPKIDLLVRKIPAKWDGTDACKKGLSLPADDVTCQEVFGRLSRICNIPASLSSLFLR